MEPDGANHDPGRFVKFGISEFSSPTRRKKNTSARTDVSMLFLIQSFGEA
ncbi:hypothetical protein RBWH47_02113 [Rhodopirellula baltica WH47]|uniref:Uncharacterized protein n=1 Tax=Rhodopirellula baltica WH47 TaxID=991778 RepID=F2AU75_RHOBT|nr:hypothetical protein RBWH47_02113 [Rhodopirellula baltica WH47]